MAMDGARQSGFAEREVNDADEESVIWQAEMASVRLRWELRLAEASERLISFNLLARQPPDALLKE